MPIRINLKEIFPSDPQEINVEKLNFNFNKLLELGVGTPGSIGLTGPQGIRGATWWVDANSPTTHTFTGLLDGDLYLNNDNFDIYQWDAGTSTWTLEVELSAIIDNYLLANGSPFVKTLGNSTLTQDDRFIVFGVRNSPSDNGRGTLNPSNNNLLYLNNFDETSSSIDFPNDPSELYNSLLNIVTDHSDSLSSIAADNGRYHIELGSLHTDPILTNAQLSNLNHNLKIKFYKDFLSTPTLPLTNTHWINVAKFSLSTPDGILLTDPANGISQNGEFEFVVPKWNNDATNLPSIPPIQQEIYINFGSYEAFEEHGNKASILADGISITNKEASISTTFGLRENLDLVLNLPYSSSNFALFDISNSLDGFFFNNKLIQTGGNFEQIITTNPTQVDQDTYNDSNISNNYFKNQSIIVNGTNLWLSSSINSQSYSSRGYLLRYDISNPDNPLIIDTLYGNKDGLLTLPGPYYYDQHGHSTGDRGQALGLIKDISEYGKYLISIHHRSIGSGGHDESTDLIIHETDSYINKVNQIGRLSDSNIKDAYRVQVHGKIAWIITNRSYENGPFLLSDGAPTLPIARLTSVDLTDPENPTVLASYADDNGMYTIDMSMIETYTSIPGYGTKYLDFDIRDNKAFILRHSNYVDDVFSTGTLQRLDLLIFDVTDPTSFNTLTTYDDFSNTSKYSPQDSILLSNLLGTEAEYGAIDVNSNKTYIVHESNLYICELGQNNISLSSTTALSTDPLQANDIKVRGNYAYILVNYADSTGAVQVWDIRSKTTPFMVSETRSASLYRSSRMAISGKHIYLVSVSGQNIKLTTFDPTGIDAPSARIGSVKIDDLQITGNTFIQNNLHVKSSVNVGPGGIHIDRGEGLVSDGSIITNMSADKNIIKGGLSVNMHRPVQSATTANNFKSLSTLITNPFVYDVIYGNVSSLEGTGTGISYLKNGYYGNRISRSGATYRYGQSLGPGGSAFVGTRISLGDASSTIDIMYSNFYGSDIILGSGVDMQANDAYGYKFSFNGSCTGTVYGLHIEGADENIIEGNTSINDSLTVGGGTPIKKMIVGTVMIHFNGYGDDHYIQAGSGFTISDFGGSAADAVYINITGGIVGDPIVVASIAETGVFGMTPPSVLTQVDAPNNRFIIQIGGQGTSADSFISVSFSYFEV